MAAFDALLWPFIQFYDIIISMLFTTYCNAQSLLGLQAEGGPAAPEKAGSIYEFTVKDIDGNDVSLEKYK